MANLTLVVDDKVLERARERAFAARTSVNALVRQYLAEYAGRRDRDRNALHAFVEHARSLDRRPGERSTRTWTREDLHAR